MAEMTAAQLAKKVGGALAGDGAMVLRGVGTLESATADQVASGQRQV